MLNFDAMKLAVIGCGIAGINALDKARELDDELEIVAFDPKCKSECQALHPEVLSGKIKPEDTVIDVEKFTFKRRIKFVNEKVIDIKLREKTLATANEKIDFDYAIIAAGAVPNFYNTPGVENCFSINSLEDTLKTKEALAEIKPGDSIAIIGAGLTGVEVAGELLDVFQERVNIYILELLKEVLPGVNARVCNSVFKYLTAKGAKICTSTKVQSIEENKVLTDRGEIAAKLIIWCAGIKPPQLAEALEVLKWHGWIAVDPYLRILGFENIYAVGDIAWVDVNGKIATKCALEAERQGRAAAVNIIRSIRGEKLLRYKVKSSIDSPVMLISLGGNKAVGIFGSICFTIPSRWIYSLKKKIDLKYVQRFNR
ncbi:MAG: FAD-dependent oxidoreductase [Methanocellales archaeon]